MMGGAAIKQLLSNLDVSQTRINQQEPASANRRASDSSRASSNELYQTNQSLLNRNKSARNLMSKLNISNRRKKGGFSCKKKK